MDISLLTDSNYTSYLGESLYSLLSALVNRVATIVMGAFSSASPEIQPVQEDKEPSKDGINSSNKNKKRENPDKLQKEKADEVSAKKTNQNKADTVNKNIESSKISCIGTSGSAAVYRIGDRALKKFHGHISKDDGISMAKYELTISRMLQSAGASGFVTIHEAGHDEKSAWIRMDFVEGTILGESDPKNTSKPPEPYISQLCTSIRSALKAGVLPWDLNDGNLILNEDGVTLIDFGLYHIFGDEGNVRPGDYYRDYTRTIKKLFLFAHEQNERTPVDLIKDLVAEMEKTQTSLQGMEMDQEGLNALDAGLRRIGNLSTFYSCL